MREYFEPLDEFERIARNKPKSNLPKGFPKVTDGSTSAFNLSRPKSVIQKLPTGVVESLDKDKDLASIGSLILTERILPNANSTGTPLQKCWAAMNKALTYGSQPAFCFFTKRNDYFGADFKLPYIKDVFLEAGKVYDKDCNVIFMRSWYQELDIKAIINKEKKLKQAGLKSGWNTALLQDLKAKSKDEDAKTPIEKELSTNVGGIEIIFGFQKGVGAKFIGYSPDLEEVVFEKVNPDPRGIIPIHYLYADLDMSNPLGRGAVELVQGLQNLIDSELQMYQYQNGILAAPPMIKRGEFNLKSIQWMPNAIWDLGAGANNSITPVQVSTAGINNFSNNYSLLKSQMLNINNSNDTSISADVGNPGFSKTPSGVKAMQERSNITDNHLAKQFEGWFGDVCETMLNIHFAGSHGQEEIDLTEEYIKKRQIEDPEFDSKQAVVMYDEVRSGFKFKVNYSTSKLQLDSEAVENLKGLLDMRKEYPELANYVRLDKVFARLVNKIGIEDPEELLNVNPDEQMTLLQGNEQGVQGDMGQVEDNQALGDEQMADLGLGEPEEQYVGNEQEEM